MPIKNFEYNTDETVSNYKNLPRKTLASKLEEAASRVINRE